MWSSTVLFSELRERACWKVEFFSGEPGDVSKSPFELVALRELVEERKQTVHPQLAPATRFNYIGLENVETLTGVLVGFAPVRGEEIRSRSKVFRRGDVLFGRLRPYLNKVFVAEGAVTEGICSGEFYVLTPRKGRILPRLLRALLASELVHPHVGQWQTGSALPRLQLHDLLKLAVPVPPPDIQQEYDRALAERMARYEAIKAELALLPAETMTGLVEALNSGRGNLTWKRGRPGRPAPNRVTT